jgi:hypothetical protein
MSHLLHKESRFRPNQKRKLIIIAYTIYLCKYIWLAMRSHRRARICTDALAFAFTRPRPHSHSHARTRARTRTPVPALAPTRPCPRSHPHARARARIHTPVPALAPTCPCPHLHPRTPVPMPAHPRPCSHTSTRTCTPAHALALAPLTPSPSPSYSHRPPPPPTPPHARACTPHPHTHTHPCYLRSHLHLITPLKNYRRKKRERKRRTHNVWHAENAPHRDCAAMTRISSRVEGGQQASRAKVTATVRAPGFPGHACGKRFPSRARAPSLRSRGADGPIPEA